MDICLGSVIFTCTGHEWIFPLSGLRLTSSTFCSFSGFFDFPPAHATFRDRRVRSNSFIRLLGISSTVFKLLSPSSRFFNLLRPSATFRNFHIRSICFVSFLPRPSVSFLDCLRWRRADLPDI
jgi:hypothetical protein